VADRWDLESSLSRTSGTVTSFLENLVGEPIVARERSQNPSRAQPSNPLQVPAGHPLIFRTAVLRGRTSGRSYVYAETLLVPNRLSINVRRRLERSSDPIGRILEDEEIPVTRLSLRGPAPDSASISPVTGTEVGDPLLARTYRVDSAGTPLMVITEWFLAPLGEFLPGNEWPA